jgi:hypothetical protein
MCVCVYEREREREREERERETEERERQSRWAVRQCVWWERVYLCGICRLCSLAEGLSPLRMRDRGGACAACAAASYIF